MAEVQHPLDNAFKDLIVAYDMIFIFLNQRVKRRKIIIQGGLFGNKPPSRFVKLNTDRTLTIHFIV